ncbi:MmcQ/YjbR family DNA-binding protein [Tepidiforma thermophila]|uniref:YjbR protein n=1 Tax=Tepidiforma thermophila (strain KCTC 52669 / CGMCC 1.13589 / G233) TaxID=2761530 RepID=A0A2A9HFG0_TEPT2|nr:MmcQ/YjbR family DNA-binding protein [Tepidiforma thermophila]PFG73840.1 YjbR protein [Tepidiforma thermophila]
MTDRDRAAEEGLAGIRAVLAGFEDVEERLSHGEAAWFVRGGRQVAMFADRHHDDRVAVWIAAPPGVQAALVAARPDRYFRPPYVGRRGWVGAWLDTDFDRDEVGGLLLMAVELARGGRHGRQR